MNNNNTPENDSDPGSYTYNTPLKEEEYVTRLMVIGDSKINDILFYVFEGGLYVRTFRLTS